MLTRGFVSINWTLPTSFWNYLHEREMSNQSFAEEQLLELLLQLKVCYSYLYSPMILTWYRTQKTTPDAARQILNSQPQIAYALITLMVTMNAINFEVFQVCLLSLSSRNVILKSWAENSCSFRFDASSSSSTSTYSLEFNVATPSPASITAPYLHSSHTRTHTLSSNAAIFQWYQLWTTAGLWSTTTSGHELWSHAILFQRLSLFVSSCTYSSKPQCYLDSRCVGCNARRAKSKLILAIVLYLRASTYLFPKAMIMRVISMTPEEINMLGPTERSSIIQLVRASHFRFCSSVIDLPVSESDPWCTIYLSLALHLRTCNYTLC